MEIEAVHEPAVCLGDQEVQWHPLSGTVQSAGPGK